MGRSAKNGRRRGGRGRQRSLLASRETERPGAFTLLILRITRGLRICSRVGIRKVTRLYRHTDDRDLIAEMKDYQGRKGRSQEQTAGPSTAPLAMKLREAPLRMTHLLKIKHLRTSYMSLTDLSLSVRSVAPL